MDANDEQMPNEQGQDEGTDEGQQDEGTEEKAQRSRYFLVTSDRNLVTNRKGRVLSFSTRKAAIEISEAFDFDTAILEIRTENFAWGE